MARQLVDMRPIFFSIVSAATLIAFAQSTGSTDGKVAQISGQTRKSLSHNQLRIVVPTWIPKGFVGSAISVEPNKDPAQRYAILKYRKPDSKASFYVQYASDGLGDPFFDLPNGDTVEPTGALKGKNPILGEFRMDFVKKSGMLMWHITWYETKQKGFPKYVMVAGHNVAPEDGKRIIESLRWLK